VHPFEKVAEGLIVALVGKVPLRTVAAVKFRPARLAHSSVKSKNARFHSADAIIGVVDAPINGTRLSAYGRRRTDPFARNLHTVAIDRREVTSKEPSNAAMRAVVLCWAPHRGDNGIPAASCHGVCNALPDRAISTPLELAELLAVIRNVALKSRHDRKGA
jgi:hypothetical protein